ncbi:hypothetical protein [Streptomyces albidoflavus]|uniref:hypothetical protein n=1 Tax=Streptomyces albidoflavus TaxID=1886 RepID=UPI001020345B|nr:hypothetical protein [Streptomyces albidoflavus]RZE14572.1 hypothetical protein C0Q66_00160 [Streptomyces albidoflavus]
MGWQTERYGDAHEGFAGAALPDGAEPRPQYFDMGSSGHMPSSQEWWAYDGRMSRPLAEGMRAYCSCGWRAAGTHPINWDQVAVDGVGLTDESGPATDWEQHIGSVDDAVAAIPPEMVGMLDQLAAGLADLAEREPLTALRVVAELERSAARTGLTAARNIEADGLEDDAVARGLGLPTQTARSWLLRYRLGRG